MTSLLERLNAERNSRFVRRVRELELFRQRSPNQNYLYSYKVYSV